MAIAFVQSRSVDGGTVTSANLAFNSNNTAGNLIIVAVRLGAIGRTITVTDTNLNSYSQAKLQATAAHEASIYYAMNCAAGANTVSVAISGAASTIRFAIHEYSGAATSSALDGTASTTGTSGNANSGTATASEAGELIFGFAAVDGTSDFVPGIEYVNSSANASAASGNLSVTPPTTETNDIMICAVSTHDNVALSFPVGWNIYQEGNNTTALRATLAWKRCSGAEGAFTITHTAGDVIVANVAVYRGCYIDATPIDTSTLTHNGASATCTANSINTGYNGARVVFTMHDSDDGASSGQANAGLLSMTERFDNASASGADAAVSAADGVDMAAGATGNSTGTLTAGGGGADINSGGNTSLRPVFVEREELSQRFSTEDHVAAASGSYRAHFTLGTSSTWSALVCTFKAFVAANPVKNLALLGVG